VNRRLPCPGPISRRSFLEVGSVAVGGLGLADLLRLRAEASTVGSSKDDTAVILVWLPGGAPHMETYDMKPEAPAEYRGEFKPIRTNVPGIDVCELLPLHAKVADRFSLIRSISHEFADHGGGHKRMMTGRVPKTPVGTLNDAPAGGTIIAKMREHVSRGVPNFVSIQQHGGVNAFALGSAYLGPSYNAFEVTGDPSRPDFQVQNLSLTKEMMCRLDDRKSLLSGMDTLRREMDRSGAMSAMDSYNQRAFNLLTSDNARKAFDLSLEDPQVRERYGNHTYGQQTLLARRLVEAGSSFVTTVLQHPALGTQQLPTGTTYNWDSHAVNCHIFIDSRYRLPFLDQAVSALVEDIHNRGLDKKVLVVVTGEFGRTPRLEHAVGTSTGVMQPGRDHWPRAMSVLVSGGGLRMGQVVGSTNARGEAPKERPLTPNDLWATVYRHLGIDYTHAFLDHSGRPMPILPFGEPISELL
jgi:hypothetical protein